ncbi:Subtilase family protein [anaerobic digester metagenome]
MYADLDGNTTRISRGADMAASKGILVVNSAGNSGNNDWHYIGAPADADSILTIGAVDSYGNFASFSSYGPSADDQVKPTVCAQGQGAYVVSSSDGVYPSNGTSFSSPIMAGAVTCLWQANRTRSNMEIIETLKKSASHYSNPDSMYGYGIPSMVIAHMILNGNAIDVHASQNRLMGNPNPFSEEMDVVIFVTTNMTANLSLVDNNGKEVWSKDSLTLKNGYNYQLITGLGKLNAGVYFLRLSSEIWVDSLKLLKN